jgi:hypothetical protein
MNRYFKQVTPPKASSASESKERSLNKIKEYQKNGCKMFAIKYNPINNRRMSPIWDLFMNPGEMERILGIRVKLPSFGQKGP